jgi:hypothetical protein
MVLRVSLQRLFPNELNESHLANVLQVDAVDESNQVHISLQIKTSYRDVENKHQVSQFQIFV